MGFFSKKEPEVKTRIIEDPYKTAVSGPLSAYLASQVGKGLPRYSGSLYEPLDPKAYNTYQNFLSLSPGEWYTKGVQEPTMKAMREEIPNIEEGWAGSLRGSGRFSDVEDYMQDTAETLAEGRYKAELEIPQAQFGMAQSYSQQKTQQLALEYTDWMKSLPEMNPNLDRALQFLAGPSGRDVITYQTAGRAGKGGLFGGGLGAILGTIAGMALAPATGGLSLATSLAFPMFGAALGGTAGYTAGSMFD